MPGFDLRRLDLKSQTDVPLCFWLWFGLFSYNKVHCIIKVHQSGVHNHQTLDLLNMVAGNLLSPISYKCYQCLISVMNPNHQVSVDASITSNGNRMATFQLAPQIKTPQSSHWGLPNVSYGSIPNQLMIRTSGNEFILDAQDISLVIYFRSRRKDSSKAHPVLQDAWQAIRDIVMNKWTSSFNRLLQYK